MGAGAYGAPAPAPYQQQAPSSFGGGMESESSSDDDGDDVGEQEEETAGGPGGMAKSSCGTARSKDAGACIRCPQTTQSNDVGVRWLPLRTRLIGSARGD